jgi:flagellar biosynthesis anti-sigma factor FlgM
MLTVTTSESGGVDLTQQAQRNNKVVSLRQYAGMKRRGRDDAAQVDISTEARQLQHLSFLLQHGDEGRAAKVMKLKEQIARGEYQVASLEVAKALVRSEISRLLGRE